MFKVKILWPPNENIQPPIQILKGEVVLNHSSQNLSSARGAYHIVDEVFLNLVNVRLPSCYTMIPAKAADLEVGKITPVPIQRSTQE